MINQISLSIKDKLDQVNSVSIKKCIAQKTIASRMTVCMPVFSAIASLLHLSGIGQSTKIASLSLFSANFFSKFPTTMGHLCYQFIPSILLPDSLSGAKNSSKELLVATGMVSAMVGLGYRYWDARQQFKKNTSKKLPSLGFYTAMPLIVGLIAAQVSGNAALRALYIMGGGLAATGVAYDQYVDFSKKQYLLKNSLNYSYLHQKINNIVDLNISRCFISAKYPEAHYIQNTKNPLSITTAVFSDQSTISGLGIDLKEEYDRIDEIVKDLLFISNWYRPKLELSFKRTKSSRKSYLDHQLMLLVKSDRVNHLLQQWGNLINSMNISKNEEKNIKTLRCSNQYLTILPGLIKNLNDVLAEDIDSYRDFENKNLLKRFSGDEAISFQDNLSYPYVIEKIAKRGDIYIFRGDMHGSIQDFVAFLKNLEMKQFLSITDEKITIKDNVHIVFHGNYFDKGYYSAEVLWLLAYLKIKNPKQVTLIRGHHEDYNIQKQEGFVKELAEKFSDPERVGIVDALSRAYELMPVAGFFGIKNDKKNCIDYIDNWGEKSELIVKFKGACRDMQNSLDGTRAVFLEVDNTTSAQNMTTATYQYAQNVQKKELNDTYLMLNVKDSYDESEQCVIRFDHDGTDKDGDSDPRNKEEKDNEEKEKEIPKSGL